MVITGLNIADLAVHGAALLRRPELVDDGDEWRFPNYGNLVVSDLVLRRRRRIYNSQLERAAGPCGVACVTANI